MGKTAAKTTATPRARSTKAAPSNTFTIGDYAYQMITQQYRDMVKQEAKVLQDTDPEHLHDMRVASRRLRTALQVFGRMVEMPKTGDQKRIGKIAKALGKLRDLDVQIEDLEGHYLPRLSEAEQSLLQKVLKKLRSRRQKAFAATEKLLETGKAYQKLKTTYDTWLASPQYTASAQLPLRDVMPDLLSPLLAHLLLHPGWLVPAPDVSPTASETLHDLRKACKHARYQAEFFAEFYGAPFQEWIGEVKQLQSMLGKSQDTQVLRSLLHQLLPKGTEAPELYALIQQTQDNALNDWPTLRQKYLDMDCRQQLRQMMLTPGLADSDNGQSPTTGRKRSRTTKTQTTRKTGTRAKTGTKSSTKATRRKSTTDAASTNDQDGAAPD